MTGRYYLRTGLYNTRFGGDTLGIGEITVAQLLKRAGYRTGLFGKWHLGKYAGYRPHERGFDEFFGHYHGHIERYDYPDQLVHNGRPVETRGYVSDLFTDAAIDFVKANAQRPFFCYLAYNAPHSPFVAGASHDGMPRGDEYIEKYLRRGLPLREARIYAMVEIVDANVGRLLKTLDDLHLRDDTAVVFMSDNGGVSRGFKAGLRGAKASVYEGGVRVPLFARWPGHFPAGVKCDAIASHIDLAPTFCELAGADMPADRTIDGRSLAPLLTSGKGASPHEYVYHTWDRYTPNPTNRWSIGSRRYKLVGLRPSEQKPMSLALYDLQSDPGESNDLAAAHPEIAARLRAEFLRWFKDVTAGQTYRPAPIPVGHPAENPVEIQPSWAALHGETVQYTFRGYDWDTIDAWRKPGDSATWRLDVLTPGEYEVTARYGCSQSDGGGELKIAAGDSSLTFQPRPTVTANAFVTERLGTLRLKRGPVALVAEVVSAPGQELMRLSSMWLKKID